jgi:hypothetical protein
MPLGFTRVRARALLANVQALTPGAATFYDAMRLANLYHGDLSGTTLNDRHCNAQDCLVFGRFPPVRCPIRARIPTRLAARSSSASGPDSEPAVWRPVDWAARARESFAAGAESRKLAAVCVMQSSDSVGVHR